MRALRVIAVLACAASLSVARPSFAQSGAARVGDPGPQPAGDANAAAQSNEARVGAALNGNAQAPAVAEENTVLPAGTIRVTVVDPGGAPAAGADVELGILAQMGKREKKQGKTGPDGVCTFEGLPKGNAQAYRVNVPFQGATYSTTPFQLPPGHGYDARVTRMPVSTDGRFLLQFLSRMYLELRDGRVRVVQQSQLANLGASTYVFPKEGLQITLPKQHTAFQTEPVMTDQRLVPNDEGFRIFGSVPPGRITLIWAFDMPLPGTEVNIEMPVPFRTYRFSIEADAPPGAKLEVKDFAAAQVIEENGNRFLVTQMQLEPTDAQVPELRVRLFGLPGPGPGRWVAVVLASLFVLLGLFLIGRRNIVATIPEAELARRRTAVLEEAAQLEKEFRATEVGPKYHARRMKELTDELALLLRESDPKAR